MKHIKSTPRSKSTNISSSTTHRHNKPLNRLSSSMAGISSLSLATSSTFLRHGPSSSSSSNTQHRSILQPSLSSTSLTHRYAHSLKPSHFQFPLKSITAPRRAFTTTAHTNTFLSLTTGSFHNPFASFHNNNTTTTTTTQPHKQHRYSPKQRTVQLPTDISIRHMSEQSKHEEVGVTPPTGEEDTIFGKMVRGEINVPKVYEDDKCIVINDINPQAPIHMLVIPRKPIQQLSKSTDEDTELLGHLLTTARKVAKQREMDDGFRTVINDGVNGAQSVYHLHVHVLGGKKLSGRFD